MLVRWLWKKALCGGQDYGLGAFGERVPGNMSEEWTSDMEKKEIQKTVYLVYDTGLPAAWNSRQHQETDPDTSPGYLHTTP